MKILLIRHGDPDYSIDNLTDKGREDAEALGKYLAGYKLDEIYSSPLGRAKATAEYTSKATGLPVKIEEWTAELGLRASMQDRMAWDLHGHLMGEDRSKVESMRPHLTAEEYENTFAELERIGKASDEFLGRLGYVREGGVYKVVNRNNKRIALFCHGGFGLTWLAVLLHVPLSAMWAGFFLHTTSITEILFDEREEGIATPRCLSVGALPHLAVANLPPSQAGIKANYE